MNYHSGKHGTMQCTAKPKKSNTRKFGNVFLTTQQTCTHRSWKYPSQIAQGKENRPIKAWLQLTQRTLHFLLDPSKQPDDDPNNNVTEEVPPTAPT
jgi:hypothetical protein